MSTEFCIKLQRIINLIIVDTKINKIGMETKYNMQYKNEKNSKQRNIYHNIQHNINYVQARTDLALENRERFEGTNTEVQGVILREKQLTHDIKLTKVDIVNNEGAKAMNKPVGTYITIESENLLSNDIEFLRKMKRVLAKEIKSMLPKTKNANILVVGLGNREVTYDALGPIAVSYVEITKHINDYFGKEEDENNVSALVPGVMAQSGMEAASVIKGVVKQTKPDAIIVIDALAARSIDRLNTTIQLTNTGINPGSGVGNHRNAIDTESMGTHVLAIGIPTIIDASNLSEGEKEMVLTLKDIDENIVMLGKLIAKSINLAMIS